MIPCLYGDLRVALATLYNLPQHQHHSLTSHQAHDFLLQFQSRNVRRKLQSQQQRLTDMAKKGQQPSDVVDGGSDAVTFGSSWLACLMLLLSPDAHSAERLFCAQTIAHRLRRSKVSEAIDWEIETQPGMYQPDTTPMSYQQWIAATCQQNPSLGQLLAKYLESQQNRGGATTTHLISDEDRIKGELSLLTLAFLSYHHSTPVTEHTQPLLTTLGAAMGALALRLRYTPQSMAQNLPASPTPIVVMILQSLQSVAMAGDQTSVTADTLSFCACACLGSIPDTILASPGGARGKLSIDPRCVVAAHDELRTPATGVHPLWQALNTLSSSEPILGIALLLTCERWAKYLPLPWEDFVEPTLECVKRHLNHPSAMAYLVAVFEAASWTQEQILSFSLGISAGQQPQQASKKRQSSKSKNRKKQILQEGSTDSKVNQSEVEFQHRGEIACRTTAIVWKELQPLIASSPEGVACLSACANACLPHWIRHGTGSTDPELVKSIMTAFQEICSHPDRSVRGQTYEPLCNLHAALHKTVNSPLESVMVDHLFQCSMRLATSCGYPPNYFHSLQEESNEELEIERNDVRDVLRAVSGGEDVYSGPPRSSSLRVLDSIVKACTTSILQEHDSAGLPHETAVHALTALAKPLNIMAEAYVREELSPPESIETLTIAFHGLSFVANKLVDAIPKLAVTQVFALGRLLNLGIASLCPAFSAICRRNQFVSEMSQTLRSTMQAAALSVVHIPELAAESTLDHTQYDIRGAFRSPGGEDHVGILVFMRLSNESDGLARHMIRIGHENGGTLLLDLCQLHGDLKDIENKRGPGIHHGKGVTPRTRRILLETISRFTEIAKSTAGLLADGGEQAEKLLQNLFHSAIVSLVDDDSQQLDVTASMFKACEVTFDLASFSQALVSQLFVSGNEPLARKCVSKMVHAGAYGYTHCTAAGGPDNSLVQYGRLRGALMTLLKASANPDLPNAALEALVVLTNAECEAIITLCQAGRAGDSFLFNDYVISSETLPTGAFLVVMEHVIAESDTLPQSYVRALSECCNAVLGAVTHQCQPFSAASVVDPRPTLCEAWFLTVSSLAYQTRSMDASDSSVATRNTLIVETLRASMVLWLYPTLEMDPSKRANDLGMSMGGAQTLAMIEFFEKMFVLGPEQVQLVARELQNKLQAKLPHEEDDTLTGMAIIGAILFRASAGGAPPWFIEGTPAVFSAFFQGCGKSSHTFGRVMQASTQVRLIPEDPAIGGVKSSTLLAGRFFETMKDATRQDFIKKTIDIATEDSSEGWKRFKALLKQASGGKKKASGFSLKPSPTSWDCDRL